MKNETAEVAAEGVNYKTSCEHCLTSGICSGLCVVGAGPNPKVFHQGGLVTEFLGNKITAASVRATHGPAAPTTVFRLATAGYVIRHPDLKPGAPRYVVVEPSAAYLVDKVGEAIQFVRERDARAYAAKHLDAEIDWKFDPL